MEKNYNKKIDLIRIIACIAILLYHLNIMNGGYLAVCAFFVLSGYFSTRTMFTQKKFSFRKYYWSRLKKIYLPLLIVVFSTIFVISLFPNILWLNLKPETTSVLLGYNNFWQINANLDYFAHHVNSPFIHLWYISILLQLDILFPFIYLFLRKLGDKIHKVVPCVITLIFCFLGIFYFYKMSMTNALMITYYHTFARMFSFLFGILLGLVHSYYQPIVIKTFKPNVSSIIFYFYMVIFIVLCFFIKPNSIFFSAAMVAITVLTCRLMDYAIVIENKTSILDKIIKLCSKLSYGIYLIQYPVLFLFQSFSIEIYDKIPLMILIILLLSYILYFTLETQKLNVLSCLLITILGSITICGGCQYIVAEDHTEEMKALKEQLQQNEKMALVKQKEYEQQLKIEEEAWTAALLDLENGEKNLKEFVKNLPVVGVGDSVMLGAIDELYLTFQNGYFDAKVSRTAWKASGILSDLKSKNLLGNPIILNLGANGDCPLSCKREILKQCEGKEVFWINVTNDIEVDVNNKLLSLANDYPNLHIIDWNSISKGHSEYFIADGIHLTEQGKKVYVETIYNQIYQMYWNEYREKKEAILKEHEEEQKKKISFYGNDLLLNVFPELKETFKNANFIMKPNFSYLSLKEEIEESMQTKTLTNKIVFLFDREAKIRFEEYQELLQLLENHEIYIVYVDRQMKKIEGKNIIDISNLLETEDIMADKTHLTEQGNQKLYQALIEKLESDVS